jgi:hypothetical protein
MTGVQESKISNAFLNPVTPKQHDFESRIRPEIFLSNENTVKNHQAIM